MNKRYFYIVANNSRKDAFTVVSCEGFLQMKVVIGYFNEIEESNWVIQNFIEMTEREYDIFLKDV